MHSSRCDVLFIAGNSRSLIANRGDLIRDMQSRGQRVAAIVPQHDYLDDTRTLGIDVHQVAMARTGTNPVSDLRYLITLMRLLRRLQPRIVFSYTAKPVIYGSLAAYFARVPGRYSMITGLGHIYTTDSRKTRIVRPVMNFLYSLGLSASNKIFFQNSDDIAQFIAAGVLKDHRKIVRTNGSGVNLERFPQEPLPDTAPVFLFVGRLLAEKGIREFVGAARQLKNKWPSARFVAVGPHDPSLPHSISPEIMASWESEEAVEFVGAVKDVRSWLRESSALVHPSYREGTPRAVLEALATGRAVITTDAPGCRETVEDGLNGVLVDSRDTESLIAAIDGFLTNPEKLRRMGNNSRKMAEEKYDVRKVNKVILEAMDL